MYELIPEELKSLDQWVVVGDSKVPMMTNGTPASSSDYRTWNTFDEVVQTVERGDASGIGFVFAENGIVGIDIDSGWTDDNDIDGIALDILSTCGGYTEISRSGRGFHILLKGDLPFKGRNNQRGVQIYKTGRYFIMTGNYCGGQMTQKQSAIDYVLDRYFSDSTRQSKGRRITNRVYNLQYPQLEGRIPLEPIYPPIENGSRNLCLTSLGGTLRKAGYPKKEIIKQLRRCNQQACNPHLSDGQLKSIVSSVMRYER